jgi:Tol biopolymer transport system component
MSAEGSEVTNLSNSPASDWDPAWSRDGSKIAYSSNRQGNDEICVVNLQSGEVKNLTQSRGDDWRFSWSPNGRRIVFTATRDGNSELYVMEADGSGQRNLSNNRQSDGESSSWSPDSQRIAFVSTTPGRDPAFEILLVNADGGEVTKLTDDPANDDYPAWIPTCRESPAGDG